MVGLRNEEKLGCDGGLDRTCSHRSRDREGLVIGIADHVKAPKKTELGPRTADGGTPVFPFP